MSDVYFSVTPGVAKVVYINKTIPAGTVVAKFYSDYAGNFVEVPGVVSISPTGFVVNLTGSQSTLVGGTQYYITLSVNAGPEKQVVNGDISVRKAAAGAATAAPAAPSYLYPLSEFNGAVAGSCHPDSANVESTSARIFVARIIIPAGKEITKMGICSAAVATSPSSADCMMMFDSAGALLAQSAGSATLFNAIGWRWANFTSPVAASDSTRVVYCTHWLANANGFRQAFNVTGGGAGGLSTVRRAFFDDTLASKPTTLNVASGYNTSNAYVPLILLG
jgi:hypothetical protein